MIIVKDMAFLVRKWGTQEYKTLIEPCLVNVTMRDVLTAVTRYCDFHNLELVDCAIVEGDKIILRGLTINNSVCNLQN